MKNNYLNFIANKVGMGTLFNDSGIALPATFLKVDKLILLEKFNFNNDLRIKVGCVDFVSKSKAYNGMFNKYKVDNVKKFILESSISDKDLLNNALNIINDISYIKNAKMLDVSGKTKGKGFSGGMKKWGFSGLRASHGVSVTHRSIGSVGQRSYPGRVVKGRKMPGHFGNVNVYVKSLKILDVDVNNGLIVLQGSVPGPNNSFCTLHIDLKKFNK